MLKRSGVQLDLDGVRTASGKWSVRGFLFLSNVRMVFVAEKPDPSGRCKYKKSGLYSILRKVLASLCEERSSCMGLCCRLLAADTSTCP